MSSTSNNSKTKQELLEDYNINKQFLDTYKAIYITYVERLKKNEQIQDELFYRFDTRI